jgi:hypothetical protein
MKNIDISILNGSKFITSKNTFFKIEITKCEGIIEDTDKERIGLIEWIKSEARYLHDGDFVLTKEGIKAYIKIETTTKID